MAENKVTIPDFHATVLHLLGLDHTRLTFRHAGRDFRLTDVSGRVVAAKSSPENPGESLGKEEPPGKMSPGVPNKWVAGKTDHP